MTRTHKLLQSAATTGNGVAHDCGSDGAYIGFYIVPSGTISAGAVTYETAPTSTYAGTWAPLGTAVTAVTDTVQFNTYVAPLLFVRARISTNVTGGGNLTVHIVRT